MGNKNSKRNKQLIETPNIDEITPFNATQSPSSDLIFPNYEELHDTNEIVRSPMNKIDDSDVDSSNSSSSSSSEYDVYEEKHEILNDDNEAKIALCGSHIENAIKQELYDEVADRFMKGYKSAQNSNSVFKNITHQNMQQMLNEQKVSQNEIGYIQELFQRALSFQFNDFTNKE
eukprot:231257_1